MEQSLWWLKVGQDATICGFNEGLAENYQVRLMEMGFHTGEQVACLQTPAFGAPRVYRVSNTVFSLDDEVANFISVQVTQRP